VERLIGHASIYEYSYEQSSKYRRVA
jgi:hypothetical protein